MKKESKELQQQSCPFCSTKQLLISCKNCSKSFICNKDMNNPSISKFKDLPCYNYCSDASQAQDSSETDYISDSQQSTQSTLPIMKPREERKLSSLAKRLPNYSDEEYLEENYENNMKNSLNHENLSAILRLFFNFLIGISIMVLIIFVFFTVREDINKRYATEIENAMIEITKCQNDFKINNCHRPVPATASYCLEKEKCIAHDPYRAIKTSKTTVALAAEILNSFVQPLELKTIAVFLLLFFGTIIVCNCMMTPRVYRIFSRNEKSPHKSIKQF